jgi:hypothetical protein
VALTLSDQVVATLVSLLVAGQEALQVKASLLLQKYLKSLGECEYRYNSLQYILYIVYSL